MQRRISSRRRDRINLKHRHAADTQNIRPRLVITVHSAGRISIRLRNRAARNPAVSTDPKGTHPTSALAVKRAAGPTESRP